MSADQYTHPLYVGLAQQVGINLLSQDLPKLIAFAEQVAVRATLVEREECAKLCEVKLEYPAGHGGQWEGYGPVKKTRSGEECAAAIRARELA